MFFARLFVPLTFGRRYFRSEMHRKSFFSFAFRSLIRTFAAMKTTDVQVAATIGFFDGVHRGHQFLIEQLQCEAQKRGLRSVVITFDRHPRQVLCPDWKPRLLTTLQEKGRLLLQTGIDDLVVLHFDEQMAALSAHDFMQQVLRQKLGVRLLLTGYDNRFGHRTAGSNEGFEDYVSYGNVLGIEVVKAPPCPAVTLHDTVDGDSHAATVSSSLIRRLLSEGRVAEAATCLGRPYALQGTVVHGQQKGRTMGFPTANLQLNDDCQLVPQNGVYAVVATIDVERATFKAMTNIGLRPTFEGHRQTIETHIFDFDADLYGRQLTVEFVERLRSEQPFPSPEALARQMALDAATAQQLLTRYVQ